MNGWMRRAAETRRRVGRRDTRATRCLLFGLIGILSVTVYGVAGYVTLGWSPFDAFYMVIITISGVGFGEVRPMRSTPERLHTIIVIVLGLGAVACSIAGLVALLAEDEIYRALGHQRMRRRIDGLQGHAVIAGFGRIGSLVAEELATNGRPFVVIERSADRLTEVARMGYAFVQGDATEETTLLAAGIVRAKILVSVMPGDAENVFVTLTARQLAPTIEIIARAEQHNTLKTLKQAGAGHVVMPAAIGARRIASLLTNPSAVEFAELVTSQTRLSLELDEISIADGSPLLGHPVGEADIRQATGTLVIAIKRRDGQVAYPADDAPLSVGDAIVLLGRRSNLDQFRQLYGR